MWGGGQVSEVVLVSEDEEEEIYKKQARPMRVIEDLTGT